MKKSKYLRELSIFTIAIMLVVSAFSSMRHMAKAEEQASIAPNYEFNDGKSGWDATVKTDQGASATYEINNESVLSGENSARINISNGGSTDWYVQLSQVANMTLKAGMTYKVSFMAKADASKSIRLMFQQSVTWDEYWNQRDINVGIEPTTYGPYTIECKDDVTGVFRFNLGGNNTGIFIDKIIITEELTAPVNREGNLVRNSEFDDGVNLWNLKKEAGVEADFKVDTNKTLSGENSALITMKNGGTASWHTVLYQDMPNMKNGKAYEISFMAKSNTYRAIQLAIKQPGHQKYEHYKVNISIGKNPETFGPYIYVCDEELPTPQLMFFIGGKSDVTINIDNVIVKEIDPPAPEPETPVVEPESYKYVDNKIYVNPVGYAPKSYKIAMLQGNEEKDYKIIDLSNNSVVYKGTMKHKGGDFGSWLVGDFSSLEAPGTYRVEAGADNSWNFSIGSGIYDKLIQSHLNYLTLQRCGDTTENWRGEPCHIDDGRRVDNDEHLDVTGGWHDASDVRRWTSETMYGVFGLANMWETLDPAWDNRKILEEIKWGNSYQLKLQTQEGYIMNGCGDNDGNYWTDNKLGTADDRPIKVEAAGNSQQFRFVYGEARVANVTKIADPEYSRETLEAAEKAFKWLRDNNKYGDADTLGVAISASVELYKATGNQDYRDYAVEYASKILKLQVTDPEEPVRGFFLSREATESNPSPDPQRGRPVFVQSQLLGLTDIYEEFSNHPDAELWKNAIELYANNYLLKMTEKNAFGLVPYGLYNDPAKLKGSTSRPIEGSSYTYRWFMEKNSNDEWDWYTGNNDNLAASGIGLIKASRILGNPELVKVAQRQLDWILGVNPFGATSVTGYGHNELRHFWTTDFAPATPFLIGGVKNGLVGELNDMPNLKPGNYRTGEYWTPMLGTAMWLEAELQKVAQYNFSGVLQPVSSKVVKEGVLPIKFSLKNAFGAFVTDATAKLYAAKINDDGTTQKELKAVPSSKAVEDNLFRYDNSDNQYIFNLNTKNLGAGKWQLRILLDDGTSKYLIINVK
jgi:hypothetical protein